MNALIDAALHRSRTVLLVLALLLISGSVSYVGIAKESNPDITIPNIYVSITHEGISPEDADRMLVGPMDKHLRSLDGLQEIRATSVTGHASVVLEFSTDVDIDDALQDVREKVDAAKSELPEDTEEPVVREINLALFPVLVVTLSGHLDDRDLYQVANRLQDQLEALPGVLEAKISGERDEIAEVIVDPVLMNAYALRQEELFNLISRNNRLVAAGAMDTGHGRFSIKVPGLIEDEIDILNLPVKAEGDRVVTFADIAVGRRTYKDPHSYARVNGKPTVALEITKRIGTNIIETIEAVKAAVEKERGSWPEGIEVTYSQDESKHIRRSLDDLFNNVLAAIILVMIVVVASLGPRSALLVGLAIPGSFLTGILLLNVMGLTLNIVVLFALILSVGMLVDGAIVVTEFADRRMAEGYSRLDSYGAAAKRMAWPITASTFTTLAVFMPLLFWPDTVGEFMKFMPITVLATLSASLLMALIVVPTVGSLVGRPGAHSARTIATLRAAEDGDLDSIGGFTGWYVRMLEHLLRRPLLVLLATIGALIGATLLYGTFGKGVEFFPDIEPDVISVSVRARGELSLEERDALVRKVEHRMLGMGELESVFTKVFVKAPRESTEDTVGVIQAELIDWQLRRTGYAIMDDVRARTADIPGIVVETEKQRRGPAQGADIQIEVASDHLEILNPAVDRIVAALRGVEGLRDVTDNRSLPGLEWQMRVDREQASRFGADISAVGTMVRMVTTGLTVGTYRPAGAKDELDIRVRYPFDDRNLGELDRLRITTPRGLVPAANFVERVPVESTAQLVRVNGKLAFKIEADVEEGFLVDQKIRELGAMFARADVPPQVDIRFRGNTERQGKAQDFLGKAFGVAIFVMAIILVTQFNSFYQALLILSAVIFSIIGVLLGLLVKGEPFGIVMCGVGVIALAGIVVNNNIVLIDTFNILRRSGMPVFEAALRTGAQRLRPVLLTTITTILGLMPMVFQANLDIVGRRFEVGAPSSQWWNQLSTSIAGGLAFATVLTLVVTPCLLVLGERKGATRPPRPERVVAQASGEASG